MAKKSAKKKTTTKAVVKTAAKKIAKKAVKKVTTKATKKTVKKLSKKAAPPKGTKTAAAKKKEAKKVTRKVVKKAPSTDASEAAVKETRAQEELPPVIVKRRYVRPEKVAKLTAFEKKQQRRLLELRDQITDMIHGIQNDTIRKGGEGSEASGSGMHQGDAGSDAYDRDFALTMLSQEANALGEIEEALHRLELGTYGICEESGQKIPQPRLEAMPFARLTVECQAAKERENSTRDFTNREFGFN
jgi:RNA polymerase-binding transcription factor DksA